MAQSYRDAQDEMRRQIQQQWTGPALDGPLAVALALYGEGRGDSDNIAGAILDAAGPNKNHPGVLWVDDRVTVIPCLVVQWYKTPKAESRWILQIAKL
jgi:Holliday junction resolvase RusA-like endonuclease